MPLVSHSPIKAPTTSVVIRDPELRLEQTMGSDQPCSPTNSSDALSGLKVSQKLLDNGVVLIICRS